MPNLISVVGGGGGSVYRRACTPSPKVDEHLAKLNAAKQHMNDAMQVLNDAKAEVDKIKAERAPR